MDHAGDGLTQPIIDPVTGAYSRALLQRRLDGELARAGRTGGSCAVFLFDVDFFKTVNDAYGHLRGDEVLHQLADRVRGAVRPGDTLFRYGGGGGGPRPAPPPPAGARPAAPRAAPRGGGPPLGRAPPPPPA